MCGEACPLFYAILLNRTLRRGKGCAKGGSRQGPSLPQSRVQFKVRLKVRRSCVRDLSSGAPLWSVASRDRYKLRKEGLPFSFSGQKTYYATNCQSTLLRKMSQFSKSLAGISGAQRTVRDARLIQPARGTMGFASLQNLRAPRTCKDVVNAATAPKGQSELIAILQDVVLIAVVLHFNQESQYCRARIAFMTLVPTLTRRIVPDSQRTNHSSNIR